ncbi:MAG TPA: hypothetical protein VNA20_15820 [Frankiaceae bacterium]|nr:hypothetical protein [Frankiaceae bacterium]
MPLFLRSMFTAALAAALVLTPGATADATPGDSGRYVSGGTVVARANGQTLADEGSVVCDHADGVGAGGLCLAFGGGNAVHLVDKAAGENVAFQVCIDNSGDGVCTSPDFGPCADVTFFSHDDNGTFYNPVGPMPTDFTSGCAGGPWKGYVVFLCEGAHTVGTDNHAHAASTGTAVVTSGGEGQGTFCGGMPIAQSRKPYSVGSGARYVSGGTAASRENGTTRVDEGTVVCNNGNNEGVGGFCTSFGGGNAMAVFDAVSGTDVAYQVCIDNNADGFCTSPDPDWSCPDYIAFSHDDDGAFYNPVGPLPTGFSPGCGGSRAWQGYVVFLCEGSHVDGITPHVHPATTGTGRVTTGGEGTGTFCGGSYAAPSRKRYRLNTALPVVGNVHHGGDTCTLTGPENSSAVTGQSTAATIEGRANALDFGGTPTDPISLQCLVRVNGSTVALSKQASGTGVATVPPEAITFNASDADSIQVCAAVTTPSGSTVDCDDVTETQVPPQAVQDLADGAGDAAEQVAEDVEAMGDSLVHPFLCPLLAPFAGTYGTVVITPEGDVSTHGEHLLDCPPYA